MATREENAENLSLLLSARFYLVNLKGLDLEETQQRDAVVAVLDPLIDRLNDRDVQWARTPG